jgi:hypothetical protein
MHPVQDELGFGVRLNLFLRPPFIPSASASACAWHTFQPVAISPRLQSFWGTIWLRSRGRLKRQLGRSSVSGKIFVLENDGQVCCSFWLRYFDIPWLNMMYRCFVLRRNRPQRSLIYCLVNRCTSLRWTRPSLNGWTNRAWWTSTILGQLLYEETLQCADREDYRLHATELYYSR